MRRDAERLETTEFDLAVIGGGIYGACIARDAALRGLKVALIERSDFGAGTSFNSLKLIHGGFRYLQSLDFRRIRESVRERRYWLWAAPHLVRPLRFVMPTHGYGTRGPEALWAGLRLYGLLSKDRNRGLDSSHRLPGGRLLSPEDCMAATPGLQPGGLRGGAEWYDAQVLDTEHLLLECVRDAVDAGAVAVNYVEALGLRTAAKGVTGVRCRDRLGDTAFDLRALLTVNATGPFTGEAVMPGMDHKPALVKSMNLIVPELARGYAFGVNSTPANAEDGRRLFFVTPWRGLSIIGTSHAAYTGDPDACRFSDADVNTFLEEINTAMPHLGLTRDDVLWCYGGLTPAEPSGRRAQAVASHRGQMIDHAAAGGHQGLISVVGEKYTTARAMAERVVDLALKKLGRAPRPCAVLSRKLPGASAPQGRTELLDELCTRVALPASPALRELVESYGTAYPRVLDVGEWQALRGSDDDHLELYRRRCLYG
ncbi:glycerol-3-phosphate dehydrogenase/oxidase, partial [Aquisalimonas sp.]|uniref:glycerol-3-phosphate dehydrogenase/oxidase n=1 Tax=Aquisalimonas sp. TaxID=1872621 RepID=UPI0025B7B8D0